MSSSISFKSGGRVMARRRTRAPASSITSIALSGRQRAGDVTFGHLDGRHYGIVGDLDSVVFLVPLAEPLEDLNRLVLCWSGRR